MSSLCDAKKGRNLQKSRAGMVFLASHVRVELADGANDAIHDRKPLWAIFDNLYAIAAPLAWPSIPTPSDGDTC
jgi:hypothetical protein